MNPQPETSNPPPAPSQTPPSEPDFLRLATALQPDPKPAADPSTPSRHRLGPLLEWVPLDGPVFGRLYALGVLAAALGLLWTAYTLNPHPHRMGTHQQLGLPPCGFVIITGYPCPTCGMTTAFAHLVRGELLSSIRCQVAGFLAAAGVVLLVPVTLWTVFTGRRPALNWYRISPTRVVGWGLGLLITAWAVKIGLGLLDGSLPVR